MIYQILLSPHMKRCTIVTDKHGIHGLLLLRISGQNQVIEMRRYAKH